MDSLTLSPTDLIMSADALAREKNIDRDDVLQAMEIALSKAAKGRYGQEYDIRAVIDPHNGSISLSRYQEVVEDSDEIDDNIQISLTNALKLEKDIKVGEFISEQLPPIEYGRIAAQTVRQVMTQHVREAERAKQYEEYKDRVGEVINGTVKRIEYGNVTVDLGKAEAVMRREEIIPREHFRRGDRVRAYIYDVRADAKGPQIFVSRTHPQFMGKLFEQEVPEIYDGMITIKSIARDPGSRAKISVHSTDPSVDPVGACVGMRGSRVQAVVSELQGEKIDIVPWSEDIGTLIVNAMAPAEVSKVVVDDENKKIEVVVTEDQQSLAIGRRGQNVRLASMLVGWEIDILTEAAESEKREAEQAHNIDAFMKGLDVDEVIARLLVAEGYTNINELTFAGIEELSTIEGFDESLAEELQMRASEFLRKLDEEYQKRKDKFTIDPLLENIPELDTQMIVLLAEDGIKTLQEFAELSGDELVSDEDGILRETTLDIDTANHLIMQARINLGWFSDDELAQMQQDNDKTVEDGTTAEI